ncbi:hypothetical protein VYU27_009780 [Nannochloropsis oceanica]
MQLSSFPASYIFLLLTTAALPVVHSFILPSSSSSSSISSGLPRPHHLHVQHGPPPLWMGGKWVKDPSIAQGIADMVKNFQQKKHAQTETVDRYLQDGIEGIKLLEPSLALAAFETALKMDNETGLLWHHGAMLYYLDRPKEAVEQLDKASARYEEQFEQPATEEGIWRAAALLKLHGAEEGQRRLSSLPPSPFGEEKRQLMGLVAGLFKGEVDEETVLAVLEGARANPYGNYALYGNFYLGLWHDASGRPGEAVAAMGRAMEAPKGRQDDVMYAYPRLHLKCAKHG